MKSRRKFTPEFKVKVVMETLQERESVSSLARKYKLTPDQIHKWKREFKEKAALLFTKDMKAPEDKSEREKQKLYGIIGQQKVGIDFLKKALS